MKRKIISVLFALVLACSFSLVAAVPTVANGGNTLHVEARELPEITIDGILSEGEWDSYFWFEDNSAGPGTGYEDDPLPVFRGYITNDDYYLYMAFDVEDDTPNTNRDFLYVTIDIPSAGVFNEPVDALYWGSIPDNPSFFGEAYLTGDEFPGDRSQRASTWGTDGAVVTARTITSTNRYYELKVPLSAIGAKPEDTIGLKIQARDSDYPTFQYVNYYPDMPDGITPVRSDTRVELEGNFAQYELLPYSTIQAAIDSAADGDTIKVAAGTYVENILIEKALTVRSTDGAEETIIDSVGFRYIVWITSADVTFEGFTVTDPTYAGGSDASGIVIGDMTTPGWPKDATIVSNVYILNNIVKAVRSETGTASAFGATGINIGPSSNVVVSGNRVENIHNPDGASVDHTCGINVWGTAEVDMPFNIAITNNEISDIKYNGILLQYASNVQIENNPIITGCETGIRVEPFEEGNVSDLTVNSNNFADNLIQLSDVDEVLDIQGVLDTNIFDRAVVIDREGGSLLHIIWSSIQDGIEAAQTDDTVNVADGTYTEDLTIGVEGLTLQAGSSPVLKGTIDVLNGADDVTIDGFNIQPTSGWAVDVWQAGNVTVTRCTILGLGAGGDVDGIAYRHSAPTEPGTVTDNELTDCDLGIMIDHDNAGTFTVTGNTVVDNRKAISIGSLSDAAIEDNPIISGSTQIGVEVFGTGTVSGNVFQDNAIQVVDVNENLNIEDVLANNTFDRAVTVDHLGASLLHTIWSSIQDGVDAATGGDTVKVAAGIYKEHITIDKSNLRLMGEDKQTTIIDATQDSSWPIAKPGILIGEYPLIDGVHGVTVSGFTIRDAAMQEGSVAYEGEKYGVGPQALAGILIYNSSSNTIENNILINNYWQIFLCAEWPAAGYTECMNNRIANNIIQNSENDGVYLYSDGGVFVQDTEIIENEISNAYGEFASGVEFWGWPEGGDTPTISSTVIKRNLITGCTYGVRIRKDVSDITGTSINLNNFITNTNYGVYNGVASTVDATRNWWGHPTGPSRELPHGKHGKGVGKWVGKGDRVSDNVDYMPWLRKSKEKIVPTKKPAYARHVVLDKTGEYGWNTFSTPIFLDDEADTWKELYKLTDLDYSLAYRFDSDTQEFVHLPKTDEYAINPGEGFFIKMDDVGSLSILYSTEVKLIPPSRGLKAGWNLIGLANLEDMDVKDAFASIATAPGLAGYSQVVSPIGNVRPGPVLADGKIYVGESYWVYMLGARTLAGFTMTPVDWVP